MKIVCRQGPYYQGTALRLHYGAILPSDCRLRGFLRQTKVQDCDRLHNLSGSGAVKGYYFFLKTKSALFKLVISSSPTV
jgi:hypothetical protein